MGESVNRAFRLQFDRRLRLFILAYNLGNFLRRLGLPKAIKHGSLRSVQIKLIKIEGRLVRHAQRLVFQVAEVTVPGRPRKGQPGPEAHPPTPVQAPLTPPPTANQRPTTASLRANSTT